MKKTIIGMIIFTLIIVAVLLFMKKPQSKDIVAEKVQFEYTSNMSVVPFQNSFLIYDGKKLICKNDKAEDIFSIKLVAENYSIKASLDNIYILDKNSNILYKLSKNGEVLNQSKFMESGQEIYLLKNSDIIVSYSTQVNTDGIIIYDKDLKKKKDINYPNGLIGTISYEEGTGNTLVSVQVINEVDIINAIYEYDSKYDVLSVYQNKNIINMNIKHLANQNLILDPNTLYIMDNEFKNISKISAQSSFEKMIVVKDKIYLQDGAKTVRIFDKNGDLIEEKNFKENINNILYNVSQIVYVANGKIYTDKNEIVVQEDIDKSILLSSNKLILFFRGGIRIADIPY